MPVDPETTFVPLLYNSCTYLDVSDLGDETACSSCIVKFGWKDGSETPVKLCCGHIYGLSCLREVVRSHVALRQKSPPCPTCRADFLNVDAASGPRPLRRPETPRQRQPEVPRQRRPEAPSQRLPQVQMQQSNTEASAFPISTLSSSLRGQDTGTRPPGALFSRVIESHRQAASIPVGDQIDTWVRDLTSFGLFGPPLTPDQRRWIRRTEDLWLVVHDAVIASPSAQTIEALVNTCSIYEMYVFCKSPSTETIDHTVNHMTILETQVPRPWMTLMDHMDQAGSLGIGDDELMGLFISRFSNYQWLHERKARLRSHRGHSIFH